MAALLKAVDDEKKPRQDNTTVIVIDVKERVKEEAAAPAEEVVLEGVALDPTLMQADGIHPAARAQPRLLENVWPVLEPMLRLAPAG